MKALQAISSEACGDRKTQALSPEGNLPVPSQEPLSIVSQVRPFFLLPLQRTFDEYWQLHVKGDKIKSLDLSSSPVASFSINSNWNVFPHAVPD
jgi:hypothetical protein